MLRRKGLVLLPHCVSLWIGPKLGAIERACLRSIAGQGHRLTLFCYQRPDGVPGGIEVADAGDIIPANQIVRYRSGSYALFANRFRYEAQRRGLGTWLDCDAYLLKPLDGDRPYLLGEFEPGWYANGVLRMPSHAPHLDLLLEPFEEKRVPPWLPFRQRVAARLRQALSGRTGIEHMPWGSLGPRALTAVVNRLAIDVDPLAVDVLYPVRWQDAAWIADPNQRLEDKITPRTVSIHLWNERIKHLKEGPARPASFLARLFEEGR